MAVLGSLNLLLQASTDGLSKGLSKGKGLVSGFAGSVTKGLGGIGGAIAGIGAALGAGAIIAGLTSITKSAMENADELANTAGLIGTSVKALSGLSYAAKLSDLEVGTLTNGMKKLNVNLADAASTGKGATADALKELGLSASELSAKDPSDALKDIADGISKVENPAQKAGLAMDIFGKAGVEMVGFLSQGKEGIEGLEAEAAKLGVVLDDVDADRINMANDAFDKIGAAVEGLGNQIAIGVAPIIAGLADQLLNSGITGLKMGEYVTTALDWVVGGVGVLLDVLHTLHLGWKGVQALVMTGFHQWIWGLGKVAEGFDWVLEKIGVGKTSASEFFKTLEEDFARERGEATAEFMDALNAKTPSENLSNWYQGVKDASAAMSAEIGKGATAIDKTTEAMKAAKDAGVEFIKSLNQQINTFGMSSNAAKIYELSQQGVSLAVIRQAEELAKTLQHKEDAAKKEEELASAAAAVFAEVETPLEKYNNKLRELGELLQAGKIDQLTFDRAVQKAKDDKNGSPDDEQKLAGLALKGSADARNAILKNQNFKAKPDVKVAENTKQLVDQGVKQLALWGGIAKNMAKEVGFSF